MRPCTTNPLLPIMPDRNKTELTQNITRLAALWLDEKGFKPVETEVGVAQSWVADVAGVCVPTQTELIKLKLIPRAPSWDYTTTDDTLVALHRERYAAWEKRRAAVPPVLTAVIEVKTSVSDFRGDPKWTRAWSTNLCYVAMPEGMIVREMWPAGWGVILFSQDGGTIRKVFPSECRTVTSEDQLNVVLSLAIRRDNVTRYERLREMQKRICLADGERKTVSRVADAVRFVKYYLEGVPIEEALRYYGIRAKLPDYVVRELEQLRATLGREPEALVDVSV